MSASSRQFLPIPLLSTTSPTVVAYPWGAAVSPRDNKKEHYFLLFLAFLAILASAGSILAYYSKVSCEVAGTSFFVKETFASWILKNSKRCKNSILQYFSISVKMFKDPPSEP